MGQIVIRLLGALLAMVGFYEVTAVLLV